MTVDLVISAQKTDQKQDFFLWSLFPPIKFQLSYLAIWKAIMKNLKKNLASELSLIYLELQKKFDLAVLGTNSTKGGN